MRHLEISAELTAAIEAYRTTLGPDGPVLESRYAALRLADLVVAAYDRWVMEYMRLKPYQRGVLAAAWREQRRAEVIEQRGGEPAPVVVLVHGPSPTLRALHRLGVVNHAGKFDRSATLTPGGMIVAQKAWEETGAVDAGEPV